MQQPVTLDDQTNVHPQSLLMQLKSQPVQLEMRVMATEEAPKPVSDEEMYDAIAELLGEKQSMRASATETGNQIGDEELLAAASELAAELALVTEREVMACSMTNSSSSPVDKVAAALADFVTPGDLLKSPSLDDVGQMVPSRSKELPTATATG